MNPSKTINSIKIQIYLVYYCLANIYDYITILKSIKNADDLCEHMNRRNLLPLSQTSIMTYFIVITILPYALTN